MSKEPKGERNKKHMLDMTICYSGRYGERIEAKEVSKGEYEVSCKEIGMEKTVLSEEDFDSFIHRYTEEGVKDFDRSDKEAIKSRAANMGIQLLRYYRGFDALTSYREKLLLEDFRYAADIFRVLGDAEILGLSDEQYEKWFIRHGWEKTDEEIDRYVRFVLEARKVVLRKR